MLYLSRGSLSSRGFIHIFVFEWYWIGNPGHVLDGLNKTNVYEFLNFFSDLHLELWLEVPRGLLDRSGFFYLGSKSAI